MATIKYKITIFDQCTINEGMRGSVVFFNKNGTQKKPTFFKHLDEIPPIIRESLKSEGYKKHLIKNKPNWCELVK